MPNKKTFFISFILCLIVTGFPCHLAAITAEEQFHKAESLYKKFIEEPEKMKYRDKWLEHIENFKYVYIKNPEGTLAPASLYMCGKLFNELYRKARKDSDKKSAIEYFERIIKYFPKSDYSSAAENSLKLLQSENRKSDNRSEASSDLKIKEKKELLKTSKSSSPRASDNLEIKERKELFKSSKAAYKASQNEFSAESKDISEIKKQTTSTSFKTDTGRLVSVTELRVWSNPSYTRIVIDADGETVYNHKLLNEDHSLQKPRRLCIDFEKSRLNGNIGKIIPINDDLLTGACAGQYQSDSVRVVIDIKSFKSYKIFSLRNPFRIIIDVWGKDAGNGLYAKPFPSESSSSFNEDTTISVKTDSAPKPQIINREKTSEISETSEVSKAKLPPLFGEKRSTEREDSEENYPTWTEPPKEELFQGKTENVTPKDLARQFALGVKRIVIDPGHGGHDPGAVGYYNNILEKNIVLNIGKILARKIRQEIGCEVIMTRSTDRFLTLEERTAIANTKNADLFISLHTNSHRDKRAYGIETYFLNLATDENSILVAARENATTRKNISDLQKILRDLMQNAKINESSRMAAYLQRNLCKYMKGKYSKINDKGVKQAPFYVLLGAHMPSVLVELSFISNKTECERLNSSEYQEHLCDSIIRGIREYIGETNPTALLRLRSGKGG